MLYNRELLRSNQISLYPIKFKTEPEWATLLKVLLEFRRIENGVF